MDRRTSSHPSLWSYLRKKESICNEAIFSRLTEKNCCGGGARKIVQRGGSSLSCLPLDGEAICQTVEGAREHAAQANPRTTLQETSSVASRATGSVGSIS